MKITIFKEVFPALSAKGGKLDSAAVYLEVNGQISMVGEESDYALTDKIKLVNNVIAALFDSHLPQGQFLGRSLTR
ncbi:hypothetical protein CHS0354_006590 [Potamilus streckersoni]|uniref:Uncharacterized protein n=1 Tax=Potamilus streckersoni TaxID=2493646 RepID=A0AAE0SWQ1_9BIVA|nr:hypothetical protein CHS0354_006590 [Potamilus streckersoni]